MSLLGSKRGARATRRPNMAEVRAALEDGRVWTGLGVVFGPDGGSHYEVDDDIGVLVHVELMPAREPLMCRLGGLGEGDALGVWRIPPVGTEVAVLIPSGELDDDPMIVGVLSSGGTPGELDADTLVVKAPRVVVLGSTEVIVGQTAGAEVTIKGTTYRSAEDTLLNALVTALNAIAAATTPSTAPAAATFATAVTTFQGAAASYLATKAKVG